MPIFFVGKLDGSVSGLDQQLAPDGKTYRLSQFRPEDVAFSEADEREPFFFNDGGNQPTEGVTSRHFGGSHTGRFDGGGEFMSPSTRQRLLTAKIPNRFYCGPRFGAGTP